MSHNNLKIKKEVIEYDSNTSGGPLVSVIVVTFQHSRYIRKCLDGIVMQVTDFPIEVIVGEDSSTDDTREICIEYAEKYSDKIRLFLHNRENNIVIDGRPTGRFNFLYNLSKSKGKYIALCEGDDYWTDPLKLQKQVDFLEANEEFSGCFHNTLKFNETEGKLQPIPYRTYDKKKFTFKDTISEISPFHTSSFLFRNDALFFLDDYKNIQSGDMALFSTIAMSGYLFLIDELMSVYRINTGGLTRTIDNKNYHENRIILMDYLSKISDDKYSDTIAKVRKFHFAKLNWEQKSSKYNFFNHNHTHMKVIHKIRNIFYNLMKFK